MEELHSSITLRLAVPADVGDMAEIIIRSWEVAYRDILPADFILQKNAGRLAAFERSITDENTNAYVIQLHGKTVGIMKVAAAQDEDMGENAYELHYIYLHPDVYRMGIGTNAMEFAYNLAKSLGKTLMTVWVLSDNINSINFYQKCGFVADGKTKSYDPVKTVRCMRMQRRL